ncbi:MAG: hypothetical protein ABR582_17875, partial [Gemmatimonadaceae bacterium]
CAAALSSAIQAALLQDSTEGEISFRHGLAAQAVHDALPGPERRRLHLRAGRALEASEPPLPVASLAEHFREAGVAGKGAVYAEAAADAAYAAYDPGHGRQPPANAGELLERAAKLRAELEAAKRG